MPGKLNSLAPNSDGFRFARPILRSLLLCALLLLAPLARAQERGPLVLAKASYFFVGGKIDTSVEAARWSGRCTSNT